VATIYLQLIQPSYIDTNMYTSIIYVWLFARYAVYV